MSSVLLSENSLLDILFEDEHTPIAYMDLDYNFLRVNQAYASTDKKEIDYFSGKNYFDLYPNNNLKIFNNVINKATPYFFKEKAFECISVPEKGIIFWDWSLFPVKNKNGELSGILLKMVDVTWKITLENKLYEKVKTELYSYDEELETIIEARTKLLQETVNSLEHEINQRIKTEELLIKAKEDAEQANLSKSQFLSRMSHELRTPLNAILGFSQLLKLANLEEKFKASNNEIYNAGNHLLSMIADILDLSVIEEGQLHVSISDISLQKIVAESIALVKHKLDFRNIKIHNLISDDISIRVDATRFKEVLVNLFSNAVKYNSDNGLISIGAVKKSESVICINISDTGKGLSEKEQLEIFEPFNRLGAEYTDIEGVGIGLTISRKLMEMMGGKISVESNKGKGSTFSLDCSIGNKLNKIANKNHVELLNLNKNYCILYVEDNKSNQKLINNFLHEHSNFNLTIASTAEAGLQELTKKSFDLILLDIKLPGMDGYGALKEFNNNSATRNIPVIALTASASSDDIKKGLAAGFVQYMPKPIVLSELISAIHSELNQPKHFI